MIDFKRLGAGLRQRFVSPPYSSHRSFGSSALEWAWLAAGRGHVYLHGGQKLWDYAAGSLILAEAGGHSSTLQGEPGYTSAVASRSVVASLHKELFEAWSGGLGVRPQLNSAQ